MTDKEYILYLEKLLSLSLSYLVKIDNKLKNFGGLTK